MPISAWSHSRLDVYETCPLRAKFKFVDKIPELERPAPPKGKEHANDRGSRVHKGCEDYVLGKQPDIVSEALCFKPELQKLRCMHKAKPSDVICEQTWAMDHSWKFIDPKRYQDIWGRVIIDVFVFLSPTEAVCIDYKTGRRHGNELKHARQTQLYQLAGFMRFPKLERITTELWYFDQDELYAQTYLRNQGMNFFARINNRALEMTSATEFPASPSVHNCKFCPYQTGGNKWITGTGDCELNPL